MPAGNAAFAAELLGVCFDRFGEAPEEDDAADTEVGRWDLGGEFFQTTAQNCPEGVVRHLLPRMISNLGKKAGSSGDAPTSHFWKQILGPLSTGDETALQSCLAQALEKLAVDEPDTFQELTADAEASPHEQIASLVLPAWSQNGTTLADKIVAYLLKHPEQRLNIGYAAWGSGNGHAAISRAAVRAAAPHCRQDNYDQLEEVIIDFAPALDREEPKWHGYTALLLLECLPVLRMSEKARQRFEELRRRFPRIDFRMPTAIGTTGGVVTSPIPRAKLKKMDDAQWLSALREHVQEKQWASDNWLKGGIHELALELQHHAQIEKERFARLALRMDDSFDPRFFGSILSGIVNVSVSNPPDSEALPESAKAPLEVSTIVAVIRRLHALPNHPCGVEICWAIQRIAAAGLPDEVFTVACYYAKHDPDPTEERWKRGGRNRSPGSIGINSVRGTAAEAIGKLRFEDKDRFALVESEL